MDASKVRTVGVVGSGIMGSGIAEVAARAGADVVVVERDDRLLERGRARVESSLAKAVERGKLRRRSATRCSNDCAERPISRSSPTSTS